MTELRRSGTASAIGASLLALAVGIPSSLLLQGLGVKAQAEPRHLWLGACLFRVALGSLGVALAVAGRAPFWGKAPRPSDTALARSRSEAALIVAILGLALALRMYRLGEGLWFDEIASYTAYMHLSPGEVFTTYDSENQHVLFTLLARLSFAVFGKGAAAFRLPAALLGTASVGALYLLARRVATEREAVLSAALLAVSYHHIWFSQDGRGYTALLFFTLLASRQLLVALDERRAGPWLGFTVATGLGALTHVTMLFVVAAHAAWTLVWLWRNRRERSAWWGPLFGFGLAGLLTFMLYAMVIPQFFSRIGMKAGVPEWTNPLWTLRELAGGLHVGFAGSAVALAALVVFGAGASSYLRTAPAIVVFLGLPAVLGASVVMAMGHPLWPRFFFFLMGFGVLVAIRGASRVGSLLARVPGVGAERETTVGTAIGLALVLASATTVPRSWGPKQDFEGAEAFVEAERRPDDAVVTVGLATLPYSSIHPTDWAYAPDVPSLEAIRARAPRTWVVYTIPLQMKGELPDLMAAIQRDFTVVKEFGGTLKGGTIYVCRAEGAPPGAAGRG